MCTTMHAPPVGVELLLLPCVDVPYDLTPKFLEELLTKHKIDYVIHGDDPCILPGAGLRAPPLNEN